MLCDHCLLFVQKYEGQPERKASYFLPPYILYGKNHHITEHSRYSYIISWLVKPFQLINRSTKVDSKMAEINVCFEQLI